MPLSDLQIDRYLRQIILPEVGGRGQEKLLRSRVLVVGVGGLGSPAALYLAAAGVGTLGLVDGDLVERSNLQRQVLHSTSRLGQAKVESARVLLADINPEVKIEVYPYRLSAKNAEAIIAQYDVIIDGTDNFPSRYLLNDACVLAGKPLVHGSLLRWDGQVTVFWPGRGPCYRCLFPNPPAEGLLPTCQEAGIMGAVAGVIGTLQALEAIKIILGAGEPLVGRLLLLSGQSAKWDEVRLERDPHCAICGEHPTLTGLKEEAFDNCS